MTERAKRLAKYLEGIGWTIDDDSRECKQCNSTIYGGSYKFCPHCGTKTAQKKKTAIAELEEGLKYALKEETK